MEPLGRPSIIVLVGHMEPFNHTLVVRFMNQEDTHSVNDGGGSYLRRFHEEPGSPNTIIRQIKVEQCSIGSSTLGLLMSIRYKL